MFLFNPGGGKYFSEALGRPKILFNIHQYGMPTPLEQPRISYALNNHSFVICEASIDNPYKNLITSSYDNIVRTTLYFFLHDQKGRNVKNDILFQSFAECKMDLFFLEKGIALMKK